VADTVNDAPVRLKSHTVPKLPDGVTQTGAVLSNIVILNALSAVFDPTSVARNVKLDVSSTSTLGAVPEITPVDEFKVSPEGKEPDSTLYVIAPPSGSVATTVTDTDAVSENDPNDPDPVVHEGAVPAVIKAALFVVAPVSNVTVTP
jgi:hypothetical protein